MKKKYFVYSYYCIIPSGHSVGDGACTSEFYPNRESLKKYVKKTNPTCTSIVIIGITKMTEKEFETYWNKS